MDRIEVGLFDSCFRNQNAVGLAGDNLGESPVHIKWVRDEVRPVTFFTDMDLRKAKEVGSSIKVAWLVEPPSIYRTHYYTAIELHSEFDYVVSYVVDLKDKLGSKCIYYPLGGSWIDASTLKDTKKSKLVSIIASEKGGMPGHALRHDIIARYGDRIDAYGRSIRPMKSKKTALEDYMYSIVVESLRIDYYFSEKLIDCLTCKTIPIYWGSSAVGSFFEEKGFIYFDATADIEDILGYIGEDDYASRQGEYEANYLTAQKYRIAEDWLFANTEIFRTGYPSLS